MWLTQHVNQAAWSTFSAPNYHVSAAMPPVPNLAFMLGPLLSGLGAKFLRIAKQVSSFLPASPFPTPADASHCAQSACLVAFMVLECGDDKDDQVASCGLQAFQLAADRSPGIEMFDVHILKTKLSPLGRQTPHPQDKSFPSPALATTTIPRRRPLPVVG